MLPKTIWRDVVLPRMGAYLGMKTSLGELQQYKSLQNVDLLPASPVLKEAEWFKIKEYLLTQAPDTLIVKKTYPIVRDSRQIFRKKDLNLPYSSSTTSMVSFSTQDRLVRYGSAQTSRLYQLNLDNDDLDSLDIGGAPSHIIERDADLFVLSMGLIHPNDHRDGQLLRLKTKSFTTAQTILVNLARPVDFQIVDLDADYDDDLIVCEFGNIKGQLSWYEKGESNFELHQLSGYPGAIKTLYLDLDRDGYKDIISLMAQGDEGIYIYPGNADHTYKIKKIIKRFPPSYGSTYFELKDFNGDGRLDILYTNGDNGDYQPIMKPYHGIRIFLNQSTKDTFLFEEAVFLQLNGAFKSMAADYDLDGDLDIAAISYFPDMKNTPEESFVYFENQGSLSFTGFTFPVSLEGKWLVMDAGDYDGDQDIDLLLGSSRTLASEIMPAHLQRLSSSGVVILENTTIP